MHLGMHDANAVVFKTRGVRDKNSKVVASARCDSDVFAFCAFNMLLKENITNLIIDIKQYDIIILKLHSSLRIRKGIYK